MEFARAELAKYGWSEGKGLGASETGITKAIKPTLKFDQCGIGHDRGEEFGFHWWDHVYNKAVRNISVNKLENGGVELKQEKKLNVTTKVPSKALHKKMTHGNFVSGGTLLGSAEMGSTAESESSDSEDDVRHDMIRTLSNDQLFRMCGGLTAHKGARHGINMTAKLARIQIQDSKLTEISSPSTVVPATNSDLDIRLGFEMDHIKKKKKKKKEKCEELSESFENDSSVLKKRKSVTFAETIENVLEFSSHRRIISKGRRKSIENDVVEMEMNEVAASEADNVEECCEVDGKKKKKRKREAEVDALDDSVEIAGTNSFVDANDSLVINLFTKKKKSKRKKENGNLDFVEVGIEKDEVCEKENRANKKPKKSKKRKIDDELIENEGILNDDFSTCKKSKKKKKNKNYEREDGQITEHVPTPMKKKKNKLEPNL